MPPQQASKALLGMEHTLESQGMMSNREGDQERGETLGKGLDGDCVHFVNSLPKQHPSVSVFTGPSSGQGMP